MQHTCCKQVWTSLLFSWQSICKRCLCGDVQNAFSLFFLRCQQHFEGCAGLLWAAMGCLGLLWHIKNVWISFRNSMIVVLSMPAAGARGSNIQWFAFVLHVFSDRYKSQAWRPPRRCPQTPKPLVNKNSEYLIILVQNQVLLCNCSLPKDVCI